LRITSHKTKIKRKFQQAFKETAIAFYEANQEAINTPHYWEGFENSVTSRQNGEVVVGAYRDIFDLGNLSRSQQMTISNATATISWDGLGITPVVSVFFGDRTADTYTPGRNWVDLALDNIDLAAMFKESFQRTVYSRA
jgi:hypothetical protein